MYEEDSERERERAIRNQMSSMVAIWMQTKMTTFVARPTTNVCQRTSGAHTFPQSLSEKDALDLSRLLLRQLSGMIPPPGSSFPEIGALRIHMDIVLQIPDF